MIFIIGHDKRGQDQDRAKATERNRGTDGEQHREHGKGDAIKTAVVNAKSKGMRLVTVKAIRMVDHGAMKHTDC